jgi:hypothetical protein
LDVAGTEEGDDADATDDEDTAAGDEWVTPSDTFKVVVQHRWRNSAGE